MGMVGHRPLKASRGPARFLPHPLCWSQTLVELNLGLGLQARHHSSLGTEFRPIPSLLARASAASLPHQPSETQVGSEAERMAT